MTTVDLLGRTEEHQKTSDSETSPQHYEQERAGWGNCMSCSCQAFVDNGTGACTCGCSYSNHY